MQVIWHDDAELDLLEAVLHYERRSVGLGLKFSRAVDAAVAKIVAEPSRFGRIREDLRRCRVEGFPYCVLFVPTADRIHILVLRHHSRNPDYGLERQ
jgi:plasmid stabilization system protein ParE